MPPLQTASALHPISPHPAQAADEAIEVDGLGGLNFHLALLFDFLTFLSSVMITTLSVADLLFLSFYLFSLFFFESRNFVLRCLPSEVLFGEFIASVLV
jgi:hypothetical protein